MADVLAVLEQRDGGLKAVSREVLTAARRLADETGGAVEAVAIGPEGIDTAMAAAYGADRVTVVTDAALALYQATAYASVVVDRARAAGVRAVICGATAMGRDLAPRVAARLDCPLAADVTAFAGGETITVTRPVYSGKALATVEISAQPCVISLRPNVFTPTERATSPAVETAATPAVDPNGRTATVEAPPAAALDVTEAPIVVSGGRGLKEPEQFRLVEELAAAFGNAAVGASRAVVDAGWRPHAEQVGQTGKTVSPQLYVAVGISGAVQHLAGMRTSKVIVAINKDKDAPIFKVADYGIVGDLFEVVPRLTEAVRTARNH